MTPQEADELYVTFSEKIDAYRRANKSVFVTSSFQTQSLPLLHIISQLPYKLPVYFLNTGYHFPETLVFRDEVARLLNLEVISVRSYMPRVRQKDYKGRLLFTAEPDYCCYINKTQPTDELLKQYDIWISGVRATQSSVRASMKPEEESKHGAVRYHPMLNWTARMIHEYSKLYQLPVHPLAAQNYFSVGCEPCTTRPDLEASLDDRSGRWTGQNKVECGLHTELR